MGPFNGSTYLLKEAVSVASLWIGVVDTYRLLLATRIPLLELAPEKYKNMITKTLFHFMSLISLSLSP